jgi:pyrimidine operon attenuation protein/uracil phosphoribosyltransferase
MRRVMDGGDVDRAIRRIAHEILERNRGAEHVVLLGIPTRGVPLAERLG